MNAKIQTPYEQPPLTADEVRWSAVYCRDQSSNVGTEREVRRPHVFGLWSPGRDGARRCHGCDRTAAMLSNGR